MAETGEQHHVIDLEKSSEDLAADMTANLVQAAGLAIGLGGRGHQSLASIRKAFAMSALQVFDTIAVQMISGDTGVANDG